MRMLAATGGSAVGRLPGERLRTKWLTWGASGEEIARVVPGDDLLIDADIVSTRAITICASADAIWPWLVQLGPGRGGAYTYDWIENLLGLDMHSADTILPQFQNLAVGDSFPLGKSGPRMRVAILDGEHSIVFASEDGRWVWAFGLYPLGAATRLVSRNRIALTGASAFARAFTTFVMVPGSLVMERKMLRGIKQRAERLADRTRRENAS
ncbi:SRPBCC family protein [Nocardia beijingensis]|uniref:SRPBCC family protein n=1 Tax=Nocardia beijingensis TaxID=95162 RepID=UPI0018942708|nr:SRPBCC family protein [Nocardia beijingensis]MBF6468536.1 SRPBCC family protein [Nocardia beijingensis]